MIKQIQVVDGAATIPSGFCVELSSLTVITGENNVGKTNFINLVKDKEVKFKDENDADILPEILYVSADNIKPGEDTYKSSAKTTDFIEKVSSLFLNLGLEFKLTREADISTQFNLLKTAINKNIKDFTNDDSREIDFKLKDALDEKTIIQLIIEKIVCLENTEKRKLEDLGQGTQRILIFSILKAYLDILIERRGVQVDKKVLIIIEEPEVYLHPKYKRAVNATLEKIASQSNHQVLITTHDPYFTLESADNSVKKKIYSFSKNENVTIAKPDSREGIEDELLFVLLFGHLIKRLCSKGWTSADVNLMKEDSKINLEFKKINTNIKIYKAPGSGTDLKLSLPITVRHIIHHQDNAHTISGVNKYSESELDLSISMIEDLLKKYS
jgi:predicted ATP-dependent endonuclease of OLD family